MARWLGAVGDGCVCRLRVGGGWLRGAGVGEATGASVGAGDGDGERDDTVGRTGRAGAATAGIAGAGRVGVNRDAFL